MKTSLGDKAFDWINALFLCTMAVICVVPLLHVLSASFSDPGSITRSQGVMFWPRDFTVKGYELVFSNKSIISGYGNTIFYVTAGTLVNLLMTSLGAYVLSRKDFLWRDSITILVTVTMFFSGGLIPSYLLVKGVGLLGTRWALIIPSAISVWNLIVLRTSFASIPASLEESARIDGANDFTILFRIVLPLSKPVLAVMFLFYAVGHWNEWFSAMIYLNDRGMFPLQLILKEILVENQIANMTTYQSINVNDTDYYRPLIKYTTIVVATVPILCMYPFIQKYFVQGVMIGSLKE
ncbi:carbohydrate ABC transporter permease [Paenibacillus sp. FSL L8-0708]|uniref:carbohydrate ABC transporter permease n=1 Tax=Paenibacillus sp. FSL L8-0708 TaxID=2975311 RepID=UPI0030FC9584